MGMAERGRLDPIHTQLYRHIGHNLGRALGRRGSVPREPWLHGRRIGFPIERFWRQSIGNTEAVPQRCARSCNAGWHTGRENNSHGRRQGRVDEVQAFLVYKEYSGNEQIPEDKSSP